MPHKYKVQVAKAYIVLKEGISPSGSLKKEIKELCEKNLSKFSIPYDYEYRKSLPKTLIGKVDYKQLEREAIEKSIEMEEKESWKETIFGTNYLNLFSDQYINFITILK